MNKSSAVWLWPIVVSLIAGIFITSCGNQERDLTDYHYTENPETDNRNKLDEALRLELRRQAADDKTAAIEFLIELHAAPDSLIMEKLLKTGIVIYSDSGPVITGKGYPDAILKSTRIDAVKRIEKAMPFYPAD